MLTAALTGHSYLPKIRVSIDKAGIPKLIPAYLRSILLQDRLVFVVVQTILGIHRLIAWNPKVDFSTIVDPHNGIIKTISLDRLSIAKSHLLKIAFGLNRRKSNQFRLSLPKARFSLINSAGPNGPISSLMVIDDAIALSLNPKYLIYVLLMLIRLRGYLPFFVLIFMVIVGLPIYLIVRILN